MLDFLQNQSQDLKSLAIMGGTFDPVHFGHLSAAQTVQDLLSIDKILFLPSGDPPHKQKSGLTPAETRFHMTQLAIRDNPGFITSRLEIDREGRTYTIDTIHELRKELPAETKLYFIVGADAFLEMPTWYHAQELLRSCSYIVVNRPGYPLHIDPDTFEGVDYHIVEVPPLDISSTEIRKRVREGRSIKYLLPDQVIEWIYAHHLYEEP